MDFFRVDSVTDALRFIKRIILKPTPWLLFNGGIYNLRLDRVEMNILSFAVILLGTVQKLFMIYLWHNDVVPFTMKIILHNIYFG